MSDDDSGFGELMKELVDSAANRGGMVMERFAIHMMCDEGVTEKDVWVFATLSERCAEMMVELLTLVNGAPPGKMDE